MKKTKITGIALLALLLSTACGSGETKKMDEHEDAAVSVPADSAFAPSTNIRYVDMDSVFRAYTLAQQTFREIEKLQQQYQAIVRQKQSEIETLGANIQQKQQNNSYLSEASFNADVQDFNKKQNAAARYISAQENQLGTKSMTLQKTLNDSVMNYIRIYNAKHNYDAILLKDAGLYFNPSLDITGEIIAGLNARFNKK